MINKPIITCIVTILMTSFSCKVENPDIKNSQQKPNIIFILADDLGYGDLSMTGQEKFNTPNIDQLAADGMFFTQHYSGSTVCAPSRSSLMTGLHTGHTPVRGNKEVQPEGQEPLISPEQTLPELLQSAGYVTGAFGKWGLGYPGSKGDPGNLGFDTFYGYNCQRMGHNYYPHHLWDNNKKILLDGNKGQATGDYGPELIHQQALDFIDTHKDSSFFMFYPSIIPHAELIAPDKYMEKYIGKYLPETNYVGVNDQYETLENGLIQKTGGYSPQENPRAAFAAMVHILDEQVGDIRRKVEQLGIASSTLIIFTSDNGAHEEGGADPEYFKSNADFRGYKRDLYEGGIRVPMIAYWPDHISAGINNKHISAFWDILPTFCDIAGIEIPNKIDGISFYPSLTGKSQKKHDHLYWEFHEQGARQAVRMGPWKGVRLDMGNNPDTPIELYNLDNDISENNNIAADNPQIINMIDSIMKAEHVMSDVFRFRYEQ